METPLEGLGGQEWIQHPPPPIKEASHPVDIESKNICIAVYQLGCQT